MRSSGWRSVEVRTRQISRRPGEYSARSRCYLMYTSWRENERIHKAEKNTMQGASTLLSYPMYCAPWHVRVLRSPRAMSSHRTRVPRLSQITIPCHDLEISQHSTGPAPLGGDRYNYIQSTYRQNVQSTAQSTAGSRRSQQRRSWMHSSLYTWMTSWYSPRRRKSTWNIYG